jgi:hypothetical protein
MTSIQNVVLDGHTLNPGWRTISLLGSLNY